MSDINKQIKNIKKDIKSLLKEVELNHEAQLRLYCILFEIECIAEI